MKLFGKTITKPKETKQEQVVKKYRTKGAKFGNEKAQVYGQELENIANKHSGMLTPNLVVQEAESEDSPLHEFFDWSDKSAAAKYRLAQARQLISNIEIVITVDGTEQEHSAYCNVVLPSEGDEKTSNVYITTQSALTSATFRDQVLVKALDEARYWKAKYQHLTELATIFKAIDQTEKVLKEDI